MKRIYLAIMFAVALTTSHANADIVDLDNVTSSAEWWALNDSRVHRGINAPRMDSRAIFSIFRGNAGLIPSDEGKDSGEKSCSDQSGNPVVISTGNKIEPEIDFTSLGEVPLELRRTFNNYATGGIFGINWVTDFDRSLKFLADGNEIITVRPDGRNIKYIKAADGVFYEDKGSPVSRIVLDVVNYKYTLYGEDNSVETYTAFARLTSFRNQHGVGFDLTYNGLQLQQVTHTSGRNIKFIWEGNFDNVLSRNWISKVIDPDGNQYAFAYVFLGDCQSIGCVGNRRVLTKITKLGNPEKSVSYHYEDTRFPEALTGKSYNGIRYSTFTYDSLRRVVSSEHAGGVEKYTYSYTVDANDKVTKTVVTNPLGKQATHFFDSDGNTTQIIGAPSTNCPSTVRTTSYDSNGNPNVAVDFNGNITDYDYNAKGQLEKKVEAYGTSIARTTQYVWSQNRIISITVLGLSKTELAYAANGRLLSTKVVNISNFGVMNQARQHNYSYTNHANGMLASVSVDGPLSGTDDSIITRYNSLGDLVSTENNLGHKTIYSNHDGFGRPGQVVDANGAVTEYEYDARGRVLLQRTFPSGSPVETRYVYGASGSLDAKIHSDGNSAYYHYDAAQRLIQEDLTEPGGGFAVKRYTYNAMSNPVKIEVGRDN